jgi:hypothetical protein
LISWSWSFTSRMPTALDGVYTTNMSRSLGVFYLSGVWTMSRQMLPPVILRLLLCSIFLIANLDYATLAPMPAPLALDLTFLAQMLFASF